jgi:hypothetical protein
MNVPPSARPYASAADMRASYRTTRARLMSAPKSPQKPATAKGAPPTEPQNVAAPPAAPVHIAEPEVIAASAGGAAKNIAPSIRLPATSLPLELAAIVVAVCAETNLTRDALMSDIVSDRAVEARKLAAALAIRRLAWSRGEAARAFAILEPAVRAALRRVDRTLIARAIPAGADLATMVRLIVADWGFDHAPRPGIADIKRAVCAAFAVTRAEIESAQRQQPLAAVRQLAMALTRRLAARSLPEIGRHFGGRDHTTVIHAVRKMAPVIAAAAQRVDAAASVDDWVHAARAAMEERWIASSPRSSQ